MHTLIDEHTKTKATLKQKIEDIVTLSRRLTSVQAAHCPNYPNQCTHTPAAAPSINNRPCERAVCQSMRSVIKQYEESEAEMEEYIRVVEPMAEIGSIIRVQYIEEARAALAGEKPNVATVLAGTQAAHGANGELDNNLFAGCDDLDDHPLYQAFQGIYKNKPREDWEELPELLKKTLDCQATIRFAKNLPDVREMDVLLNGHEKLCDQLIGRFKKFVDGKTQMYEANLNHWLLLDRLEWLTDEILLFDEKLSVERFWAFMVRNFPPFSFLFVCRLRDPTNPMQTKDGMKPKVKVKRWPGAEQEFRGPPFGYLVRIDRNKLANDDLLAGFYAKNPVAAAAAMRP